MKRALSILTALFTFSSVTPAWSGMVDTYGIGSRATSMGGAVSASPSPVFAPYYNPAGLSLAETPTVATGILTTTPDIEISDYSVANLPINNADFSDTTGTLIVPHAGFAMPINDKFSAGISLYAPWGMNVTWDDDPAKNPGAHNNDEAYYQRVAITPALAYKVNSQLSLGAGIALGRSESGTDFVAADTYFEIQKIEKYEAELTDDFNLSYNIGALYQATDHLSVGLTYRSRTQANFEGDLKVNGAKVAIVSLDYDHPEQIQGGVAYRFGAEKNLLVEADAVWTRWGINKTQSQYVNYIGGPTVPMIIERNWKDTTKYSLGMEWTVNPTVTLRGGYTWDPTPVPDESLDFIWPDGDKHTVAVGAGFTSGAFTIDIAASYANITGQRTIDGESKAINSSYAPTNSRPVSLVADGAILNIGTTVSYTF